MEARKQLSQAKGEQVTTVRSASIHSCAKKEEDEDGGGDGNELVVHESKVDIGRWSKQDRVPRVWGVLVVTDAVVVERLKGECLHDVKRGMGALEGDVGDQNADGHDVEAPPCAVLPRRR